MSDFLVWVWPLFWVLVAVGFGVFEGVAIKTHRMTLSRWNWNLAKAWPPYPMVWGLVIGFLGCHFFWPAQGCVVAGFH